MGGAPVCPRLLAGAANGGRLVRQLHCCPSVGQAGTPHSGGHGGGRRYKRGDSGLALVQDFQYLGKLLDARHAFWLKGDDQVCHADLGKGAQFLGDLLG